MSANNWRPCPKCQAKATAAWEKQKQHLEESYGVTSKDVYAALVRACPPYCPEVDHTFREDFYIGVNLQGKFMVDYTGQCTECEYTYSFSYPNSALAEKARTA
jgi:hypothetical protein